MLQPFGDQAPDAVWAAEPVPATRTADYTRRALVVGSSVLLVGVAMVMLPGPAFVVIPLGLAILGLEFAWARRWLRRARLSVARGQRRWRKAVRREDDAGPPERRG